MSVSEHLLEEGTAELMCIGLQSCNDVAPFSSEIVPWLLVAT